MTQVEWEKIFLESLTTIPDAERFKMAEYYREIYGDKLEAGQTPDEILAEFGDPKECAIRILKENESELETPQGIQEETKQEPKQEKQPLIMKDEVEEPDEEKDGYWTPSVLVGMALLTVLLIVPLVSAALGILTALLSIVLAGGIVAFAGVVYVIIAPFMAIGGAGGFVIIAHLGIGFVCCGVGILLFIGGYYAVKYFAIGCWKALTWVYARRK